MIVAVLADDHVWLRIVGPDYADPFDPSYAQAQGGRWNPPDSWPTLYFNEDLATVHAQLRHKFSDRGIDPDDLDDGAPVELAAATLPPSQHVADAITAEGVTALGLPATYPVAADGQPVGHAVTQPIGVAVHEADLDGVWCRSAAGSGNELAWFPTDARPRPYWKRPKHFAEWRHRAAFDEIR